VAQIWFGDLVATEISPLRGSAFLILLIFETLFIALLTTSHFLMKFFAIQYDYLPWFPDMHLIH